jgi:hypothetical protein
MKTTPELGRLSVLLVQFASEKAVIEEAVIEEGFPDRRKVSPRSADPLRYLTT